MNRLFPVFFYCLISFSITLFGQNTSCFTFESPELTGQYGIATGLLPGDQAFWLGEWPVSLDLIHYPNGNEGFMNLTIDDGIFGDTPPLSGQSVFMGNLSMTLDFSAFNGTVSEVCFDYIDGGGVENLSVNGQPVVIVEHLVELPETIAPGVTLTLSTDSNTGQSGTLCLAGNIESFSIGGQEFGLDNLCVTTNPAGCEIWDLVVMPQPCTPNGIFFVDLSFQFANVGNEGYTILGNGNNYGNFSYDDPFPVLGPFQGDGESIYEFAVIDLAHPDCGAATFIDPVDCFAACEISGLTAYLNTCGIQNAPYLYIDFDYANVQNVGFDLLINNEFFGFYSYEDLPLQLYDFPPADELIVQVCENDNDNCCASTLVYHIPCDDANCITFNDLESGTEYGANHGNMAGDTVFIAGEVAVTLDSFSYFDGTTGFWGVMVTGQSFDNFDLAEGNHLFVSNINLNFDFSGAPGEVISVCFDFFDGGGEENIAVNGQPVEVVSFLTDVPYDIAPGVTFSLDLAPSGSDFLQTGTACLTGPIGSLTIGGQEFGLDNVCYATFAPNADCHLSDLIAEAYACENGTFLVDVAFEHENTGPDGFQVIVNNEVYGPFSYEETYVTVGPFPGDGMTEYLLKVQDIASPSCSGAISIGTVDCSPGDCHLSDGQILEVSCGNDGSFSVTFDFNYANTGDVFVVGIGEVSFDPISYGELPYTLNLGADFPPEGQLLICDFNQDGCCIEIPYVADCFDCILGELSLTPQPCNADGFFFVEMDLGFFQYTNGSFGVQAGNELLGYYHYADLPVLLGPFPGNGEHPHQFLVFDESGDCEIFGEIGQVFCEEGCAITNFIVEPYACDGESFLVDVAVQAQQPGPLGYYIFADGVINGPFSYEETYVTLGPFAGDGVTVYDFLVIDIADPSCYAYQEIGPVSCAGNCEVWDLAVEVLECDQEDNTFSILLDFNYANPNNAFFDFFVGNEFFDYFELNALPLVINGIPSVNAGEMALKVCINDQPDCCQTIVIATPDCAGPVVWPGDADSDNLAHHFDLLNLGIAYGAQGPDRSSLSIAWDGMPAENWGQVFAGGVDYAHADCNGDGVVDALDRVAIIENYGLTHGPVEPYAPPVPTEEDPSVYVDFPNTDVLPGGASFEAPVVLGVPGNPVENLYGIAFTVVFDPEVIDPASVTVSYPAGWFGSPNLNVLTIDRSFAEDGRIEVALTRIDQEEVSGYGVLCLVGGIIDDIAAMVTSEIHVAEVKAIRYDETPVPLRTPETIFQVVAKTNPAHELQEAGLSIYPNPTRSWVTIELPDQQTPERVIVQDAMGQRLLLDSPDDRRFSLEGLPAGVYWLQIRWRDRTITRKIVKLTE